MVFTLLVGMNACNRDEIFEREQYKNVFALVSDDGYNIFTVVHDLDEPESIGYVAASCGGTNPTLENIDITMELSKESFDRYNIANFDRDSTKYAHLLSPEQYGIDSWNFTIPAGKTSGKLPLSIKPEGLSPDSVYFIPLKVSAVSAYEVNPDKSDVLYCVQIKNQYATQQTATNYSMLGVRNGVNIMGQKRMHPISANKVRIMAGTEAFESKIATINKSAVILEIDEDNNVNISTYQDMVVTQVNGDPTYPNIFKIVDDGYRTYKTFLLRYDYQVGSTTYEMKEELRLEFKED
ncbi:MAG: hypothetical protein EZS26_004036 [Candidatus Ordinivivax streblomastigis]|uniref:DUF4361 domain-containing protein n=1 Tax=Candidatus Ordinivivax streblomastigis TaxID=2540710 RepID=A0A5M8NS34_9BACT|nr:MAG: hypothetical protein EZS26_004036 [Candidatus Ordinivivax streblomastigis]